MDGYDVAQICLNGHMITDLARTRPQHQKKYCPDCGQPTIMQCPSCYSFIQGDYHVDGVSFVGQMAEVPICCHECGKPYPWIEKKIDAAKELIDELDELTHDEKEKLKLSLDDITTENPRNELASIRIKKILPKVGKPFLDVLVSTISSLAAETAKKFLGM